MHDPMTLITDIHIPFTGKRNEKGGWEIYPNTFITLWHVDPDKNGDDDSCGWFMRARHGDPEKLADIAKAFTFEWDNQHFGWFDKSGAPRYSPQAITLCLFRRAAYVHFDRNWDKVEKYMKEHHHKIVFFAENPTDSLLDNITLKHGEWERKQRIEYFAHVVYAYILCDTRPWWKHPRWHISHWKIQVHPVQQFKRWMFSRCEGCGKGFTYGYSPTTTSWVSTGPLWFRSERNTYHSECLGANLRPSQADQPVAGETVAPK